MLPFHAGPSDRDSVSTAYARFSAIAFGRHVTIAPCAQKGCADFALRNDLPGVWSGVPIGDRRRHVPARWATRPGDVTDIGGSDSSRFARALVERDGKVRQRRVGVGSRPITFHGAARSCSVEGCDGISRAEFPVGDPRRKGGGPSSSSMACKGQFCIFFVFLEEGGGGGGCTRRFETGGNHLQFP